MASAAAASSLGVSSSSSSSSIALFLWLIFFSSSLSIASPEELSLVVSQMTSLQLSPSVLVEKSPGTKAGSKVVCERIHIHGLTRIKHLRKFANTVKVNVSCVNPAAHRSNVEVCFHRNLSLGIGMCSQSQWERLKEGSWLGSMSPFDHKLLDIRTRGSSIELLQVSLSEEFFLYRVGFLIIGMALMTLATSLSQSLVFYYSSAMALGILLVILMVLFQGMKLLPTGRKSSLAIFIYSSVVGVGSFLLHYLSRLLRTVLVEIGIGEDLYNPLLIFVLLFLILSGAWLGFWVVRKLVLTEDGSIDEGIAHFVCWSIRIFASFMILQSSVDPLLALEALACAVLVSSILTKICCPKFIHRLYKKSCGMIEINIRNSDEFYASPAGNSYTSKDFSKPRRNTTPRASTSQSTSPLSESDAFYSTFHETPERRKYRKDEWEKLTRISTKKALEELVSSPDFSKWAVANAERITLAPRKEITDKQRRWFRWL